MATRRQSRSSKVAQDRNLKRSKYPPDITKLVMGVRAASYKMGGTDLPYLFGKIDVDKSGSLDKDEFKKLLRWFDNHICLCLALSSSYRIVLQRESSQKRFFRTPLGLRFQDGVNSTFEL